MEQQQQDADVMSLKLDYTLTTPEARVEFVARLIETIDPDRLTNRYLETLSDYIIFAIDKEERKKKNILTNNRMITVNKRETSFQGLAEQLESGEDAIYNMIANDKNIIFTPKISITKEDIENIPALKQLREAIAVVEEALEKAHGRKKFLLKKQLIEMRQDQYVIKNEYYKPIVFSNALKSFSQTSFDEKIAVAANGDLKSNGIVTFLNYKHILALLNNYSRLKEDSWGKFWTDSYYIMEDLDNLIERTLHNNYPVYYTILICKIDKKTNKQIQEELKLKHNTSYSVEYISSLWNNKIPKLLSKQAEEDYITWYYTIKVKGKWKRCSRCKKIKLADNRFFSRNKTSKDGFYSICKCCRNKRTGGE